MVGTPKSPTTATATSPEVNILIRSADLAYVLTRFGFNSSRALNAASALSLLISTPAWSLAIYTMAGPKVVVISGMETMPSSLESHRSSKPFISKSTASGLYMMPMLLMV